MYFKFIWYFIFINIIYKYIYILQRILGKSLKRTNILNTYMDIYVRIYLFDYIIFLLYNIFKAKKNNNKCSQSFPIYLWIAINFLLKVKLFWIYKAYKAQNSELKF